MIQAPRWWTAKNLRSLRQKIGVVVALGAFLSILQILLHTTLIPDVYLNLFVWPVGLLVLVAVGLFEWDLSEKEKKKAAEEKGIEL